MKILAITQARIGSTRLPEKILRTINGESLLEIHLKRILKSKLISKLKVATTIEPDAQKIIDIAAALAIEVYRGSINNVLERFYNTAKDENPDWIVRLTSDCPLIDPILIDKIIQFAIDNDYDYVSNTLKPTFPDGVDIEVFKFSALKVAFYEAKLTSELEHVTPYIWKNSTFMGALKFTSECFLNTNDESKLRITVDTIEDFELIKTLIESHGSDEPWEVYAKVLKHDDTLHQLNSMHTRNEGYENSILND
jgi:spore coat polysaccharide biosynthesis protein SpsF (cytidylyltransferase family)